MRIVIVTGMSGAGKTTALKMLEDMGFYCVDNLPIRLIEKFVELIKGGGTEANDIALGRKKLTVRFCFLKHQMNVLLSVIRKHAVAIRCHRDSE